MKRVLFLAYLFPPIANSGTQRPLKFAKYLDSYGWQPTVITAAGYDGHNIDSTLLSEIPAHIDVVRVPMLNDVVGDTLSSVMGGGAIGKRVGDAVRWRVQHRYRSPDLFACWRRTAFRAALRVYRESGFDAIYATGFPWTSLLVGCDVAKATSRPLLADFRDPWAGEPRFLENRFAHDVELAMEAGVIRCADRTVSPTLALTKSLISSHQDVDEAKFVTIHNGFDAADFDVPSPPKDARRFRIAFAGVWKDGYNPIDLYDWVDSIRKSEPGLLDTVEIIAAGFAPGEARRRGLDAYINEPGVLSHPDAVALMRSADIVYLPHADPERQWAVPAKVYESWASGTPVLALTDPREETAMIIRNVGGGLSVSPGERETLNRTLTEAVRTGALAVPPRNLDALAAFERRQLTRKLAGVLDSISGPTR